jgi:F0F1-type ATP synthase assembly protein I
VTPEQPRDNARGWARALRDAGPYLSLGVSLAASVLLGLLAGYWIDGKLGTRPIFFLIGAVLGLLTAGVYFFRTLMGRKP